MARECACCAALVAILCPPLGVLMMEGCGVDLLLNLLLTLLGFIPGLIHAFCVIYRPVEREVVIVQHQNAQYVPIASNTPNVVIVHQ